MQESYIFCSFAYLSKERNFMTFMRKLFIGMSVVMVLVMCAFVMAGCSGTPAGVSAGNGGENVDSGDLTGDDGQDIPSDMTTEELRQSILGFFAESLSGDSGLFLSGCPLDRLGQGDPTDEVWKLWEYANAGYKEELLPELQPLSSESVWSWSLPASLEPSAVMPFYWGSKGGKPSEGYPLYLYLHGSGSKETEWATGLQLCSGFDDSPSAYFIPQIPNEGEWYRWWQKSKQFAWEKLLRLALLSGEIDPDRIYFFGISEGGYGSQRLASFYADYLAGAGPMAGGEPLKNAPAENCANIAFSLRTGAEDTGFFRNTLTGYTADAFGALEQEHPGYYRHEIELIPGMGHHIDYSVTTPWLSGFRRDPCPKYVCWENYEMDGRFRDGFHNIQVLARSGDNVRTRYEMRISGNSVTLDVDDVTYETVETDPMYGIEMKFSKSYAPAAGGKVRIYFNDRMIDPSEEVVLTVNGKEAFKGMLEADIDNIVNSCALFFDPERLFPYSVDVEL